MKRFLKIFVPIVLSLAILVGIGWYLLSYDPLFTQDMFLAGARHFAKADNMTVAAWFYTRAYNQKQDYESIAIELADTYIQLGNYTKAEVALNRAIRDGAGATAYTKLCKVFVEQDKLLDAVELLDKIPDSPLKQELDSLRPAAPTTPQTPTLYNKYIDVTVESIDGTLYVNANGVYPSVHTDLYKAPITLTDGENLLYAVSVADSGLVSPLSVFAYTIGGIIQEVDFQDSIMEKEIRSLLGVNDGYAVSTKDLWTIKEFTIPEHTQKYDDLQHMINLQKLTIENGLPNQLHAIQDLQSLKTLTIVGVNLSSEDLEALGSITSLTELTLDNCGISTVAQLASLSSLTKLTLSNNAIRNIAPLASIQHLEELNLHRNVVVDISPLSGCAFLKKLDLAYNTVADISVLSDLVLLTTLDLSHNQVTDITVLGTLADLSELRTSHNQITDISALAKCGKLTYLDISNNTIAALDGLKEQNNITYLNFSHNQVTQLPAWSKTSKFVTIDGSYNLLTDLSPLSGHENINNILMDYNEKITSIDVLADCHTLIQVNVYGTKVTDVKKLTDQDIIVNYNPVEG